MHLTYSTQNKKSIFFSVTLTSDKAAINSNKNKRDIHTHFFYLNNICSSYTNGWYILSFLGIFWKYPCSLCNASFYGKFLGFKSFMFIWHGCNQATPPLKKFSVIIDDRTHTHTQDDLGLHVFEKYASKKECTALSLSRIGMHANKDEFIEDSKSS